MSEYFFNLSDAVQQSVLHNAEQQLNVSAVILEKDLWVCWLLKETFSLPEKMTFKGGTSLSKVFHLINRFSEDCDITIDSQNFINLIDFQHTSRSQLKKISEQLKIELKKYITETVVSHLERRLLATIKNKTHLKRFQFALSNDGEKVSFYYPSIASLDNHYLRDHVLLEFGVRNSTEPSKTYQISPMLTEYQNISVELPTAKINTLSPIRTFWEKATLIHVECHRKRLILNSERLSRHWYDLSALSSSWVGAEALKQIEIFEDVIEYKKAFFNASYANYDDCLVGNIKLIPEDAKLKRLSDDFKKMVDAGMFQEEPPKFKNIIDELKKLENAINKLMLK